MANKFTKLSIGYNLPSNGNNRLAKLANDAIGSPPGLYDINDNLVASWDTLVNTYGLNVEKDYTTDSSKTDPSSAYSILNSLGVIIGGKLVLGNVTRIGDFAFYQVLSDIKIPEGVTHIGSHAFASSRTNLTVIPKSVKKIGQSAFGGCTIKSLTIEGDLEIGEYAFANTNMVDLTIKGNITKMDAYVFTTQKIKRVTICEGNTDIGQGMFYVQETLKTVSLPNGIKTIGAYAFCGCTSLTDVEIPDSVTSIGAYAFSRCTKMQNLKLPSGLTTIGNSAFNQWNSITEIVIPHGCVTIGDEAFNSCAKVTSITIPSTVTKIGAKAFSPSTSATVVATVTYQGTKAQWNAITKGSNWNAPLFGSGAISQVICTDGTITL